MVNHVQGELRSMYFDGIRLFAKTGPPKSRGPRHRGHFGVAPGQANYLWGMRDEVAIQKWWGDNILMHIGYVWIYNYIYMYLIYFFYMYLYYNVMPCHAMPRRCSVWAISCWRLRRCFCFLSKQLGIRSCRDKRRLARRLFRRQFHWFKKMYAKHGNIYQWTIV